MDNYRLISKFNDHVGDFETLDELAEAIVGFSNAKIRLKYRALNNGKEQQLSDFESRRLHAIIRSKGNDAA